jgi:hypothetical protein
MDSRLPLVDFRDHAAWLDRDAICLPGVTAACSRVYKTMDSLYIVKERVAVHDPRVGHVISEVFHPAHASWAGPLLAALARRGSPLSSKHVEELVKTTKDGGVFETEVDFMRKAAAYGITPPVRDCYIVEGTGLGAGIRLCVTVQACADVFTGGTPVETARCLLGVPADQIHGVCATLAALHINHNDIHCGNVATYKGRLVVLDFGSASPGGEAEIYVGTLAAFSRMYHTGPPQNSYCDFLCDSLDAGNPDHALPFAALAEMAKSLTPLSDWEARKSKKLQSVLPEKQQEGPCKPDDRGVPTKRARFQEDDDLHG